MKTLELAKQLKYKEGDQVRGIFEPYARSIYRVIRIDNQGVHLHWESLQGVRPITDAEKPIERLLRWVVTDEHYDWEGALDFRLATPAEINKSREVKNENPFNR